MATKPLVVLLLLAAPVVADIGPKPRTWAPGLEVPGTDLEGVDVEMSAETVHLVLGGTGGSLSLAVEVEFRMTNLADETTFEEGFPIGPVQNMRGFEIEIDGRPIAHRLIDRSGLPLDAEPGRGQPPHDFWYVWDATFPARATSVHAVRYTLDVWHHSDLRQTGYVLRTGAPWKNSIGRATVVLEATGDVTLDHIVRIGPVAGARREADRIVWEFTDLEPTADHDISIEIDLRGSWPEIVAEHWVDARRKERWSSLVELLGKYDARPAVFFGEVLDEGDRVGYLDVLEGLVAEGRWQGDVFEMPAGEPDQCTFPKDMPIEHQLAMIRRMGKNPRPYAHAGRGGALLDHLDRVVRAATLDPDDERGRSLLARWSRIGQAALDGRVTAGGEALTFDDAARERLERSLAAAGELGLH